MLKIVQAPNGVLSQKAKKIAKVDKETLKLISEMEEALLSAKDPIGVGLAAPQVGKSLQLFVAKPTKKSKLMVFINPHIEKFESKENKEKPEGKHEHKKLEGCLSLKDIWGEVERHDSIYLSYTDGTGKKHSRKFDGFLATIIQHETDHLNGVLFPRRVLEQGGSLYKSEKDEKGEDVFEEIKI